MLFRSSGSHVDLGAAGPQTVPEIFAGIAAQHATRPALYYGGAGMDYATLDARSDALAAHLQGLGVTRGDLVGITSRRGPELLVAVMAVLKAGAGYVPFDTLLPSDRLAFMARDTDIKVLLGECASVAATGVTEIPFRAFAAIAPAKATALPTLSGDDIAYVMYTSGTTGTPKGVVLPHRSIIRMQIGRAHV